MELLDMLSYARPAGSHTEREFIERYVLTLPGVQSDYLRPWHNWHVQIGTSRVLWSCHTDTVHYRGRRQRVKMRGDGIIKLHKREKESNCLGADDTAGCYIMRQMILRGIPGHYVFHASEERGCHGSEALAAAHGSWLRESFDFAIALDRGGKQSIITHQSPGRTASDLFAQSLADALPLLYHADDTGIYTDTVSYADLIPECSNLSVGYEHCHSARETLDSLHVDLLLESLCTLDQSALTVARIPGEYDVTPWSWDRESIGYELGVYARNYDAIDWDDDDDDLADLDKREAESDRYLSEDFYRVMLQWEADRAAAKKVKP